jgi:hypothetical protein
MFVCCWYSPLSHHQRRVWRYQRSNQNP